MIGLAGVIYALNSGPAAGWSSPGVLIAAVLGVAGLAALIPYERRVKVPMLRLSLFKSRQFNAINVATVLFYGGLNAVSYLLILQMELRLGYSASAAGAALIPSSVVFLAVSPISGVLVARLGPRWLMVSGMLLVALGFGWAALRAHPGTPYAEAILPTALLWGLGIGLAVTPLTAAVLAAVSDSDLGEASARRPRTARDTGQGGSMNGSLTAQTVVVIGGSAGIGLETARRARAEGADVVLVGRDAGRLKRAAGDVGARSTAAFDAHDADRLGAFFADLPGPIDHVLVTAGNPYYARIADMDLDEVRRYVAEHLMLPLYVGRAATGRVRPGGSLVFMGGTGARRPATGLAITSTITVAFPALIASMAIELAPIRVNLIAAGFVDTPLSARLLGDDLDKRRAELRATLPIGRVVEPADVAALAVHLMTNTALTGATYDIDGGQQFVARS